MIKQTLCIGLFISIFALTAIPATPAQNYPNFSGIYPHLATYNQEGECGTGAVVPWIGKLWTISYGPHFPFGSSDKLYEIDGNLNRAIRPESIGGTHANRTIHKESKQLIIGWHFIDENGTVRTLDPRKIPGRMTGNARHLTDPENKVYFASMEEGFYEVDVRTLDVKTINLDGNAMNPPNVAGPLLPGYHGKGLYSSQGRLVYANNGETSDEAKQRSDVTSGCLAEWDGKTWNVVLRNQFTEVSGPGGIYGNGDPNDPLWSIGWDDKSLILMLLDGGEWHKFRLPKASHTYDGGHGWHTEWPRIRELQPDNLLMTMHGTFWRFPKTFSKKNAAGIQPLSTYLKIIGDFCYWNGQIVFGCDDAAKSDFRTSDIFNVKGTMTGQSNSNLWFTTPDQLDNFGPALGRGGPWKDETVKAGVYSDPYLFSGYDYRMAHIVHHANRPVEFTFEIDPQGTGDWKVLQTVNVPASGYANCIFDPAIDAPWIRVKTNVDCEGTTLTCHYADKDNRSAESDPIFAGLATAGGAFSYGLIRPRGEDLGTLHFAASAVNKHHKSIELGYYEIGPDMKLQRTRDSKSHQWLKETHAIGDPLFTEDEASLLVTDVQGNRYRLPKGDPSLREPTAAGHPRTMREIVTERTLYISQGNWYELPRQNSGGFAKIRPVASTDKLIVDLCSWRGMLVLSGIDDGATNNPHVVTADDGQCALWFGTIDDLWKLGKPRGQGGVWKNTNVKANQPSDPYLMTGYDQKSLTLSHDSNEAVIFQIEVDITGDNHWAISREIQVDPNESKTYHFPEGFNAYWVRLKTNQDTTATATFNYS